MNIIETSYVLKSVSDLHYDQCDSLIKEKKGEQMLLEKCRLNLVSFQNWSRLFCPCIKGEMTKALLNSIALNRYRK